MKYIYIWLILFSSSLLLGFLKKGDEPLSLYKAYSTNSFYTLGDFLKDRDFHLDLRKNLLNPFFSFVFISLIFILTIGKIFIFILASFFSLFFIVRIFMLHFGFSKREVRMYKSNYKLKYNSNLVDLFIRLPLMVSKSIGFVMAYSLYGAFVGRKPKVNYKKMFNNLLFILIMGVSWWLLYITYELARELTWSIGKKDFRLRTICIIIVGNFRYKFNFFLNLSSTLRVYLEEGRVVLNPNKYYIQKDPILQTVKIYSLSRSGKVVTHPGIKSGIEEGSDTSVQLTGRPLEGDGFFKVKTLDYKNPYSYIVYNVIRDKSNVNSGYYQILRNLNINNNINASIFQKMIFEHRLVTRGCLRYESLDSTQCFTVYGRSFIELALENRVRLGLDSYTVAYYDLIQRRWDSIPNIDRRELTQNIERLKVINFHDTYNLDSFSNYTQKKILYDVNGFHLKLIDLKLI